MGRINKEFTNPLFLMFGDKYVKYAVSIGHTKLMKDMKLYREFVLGMVERKIMSLEESKDSIGMYKPGKSLIDLFFQHRLEKVDYALTNEEIADVYISLMIPATGPPSKLLTMATYYMLQNPRMRNKVTVEMWDTNRDVSMLNVDSLNRMEYTTSILKETLRLASPTPTSVTRIATADLRLGDYNIKKGTRMVAGFIVNNYDANYHVNPEKFDPDRWYDMSTSKFAVKDNPFIFTPFSMGARNCMGQHLAMVESRILLSLFVKKFGYAMSDKTV